MMRFLKMFLLDIYRSEISPFFNLIVFMVSFYFLRILLAGHNGGLVFLGSIIIAFILPSILGKILSKALRWILGKFL